MYAVSLRIPVNQYLPFDLSDRCRTYVNVSAFSKERKKIGEKVVLHENCRDAEVIESHLTDRKPSTFDFNLDIN